MGEFAFVVPCEPVGKARARVVRCQDGQVRAFTPKKTAEFENRVGFFCRAAMNVLGASLIQRPQPIRVWITAVFSIPKSRKETDGAPHTSRPDADNIVKAVLDGMQGIAFADDCQVSAMTIVKRWTTGESHVEVSIKRDWE